MIPLPNQLSKLVGRFGGILPPWNFFLQQFVQAPPKFMDIIVDTSPFSYQSREPGFVYVTGGTVSDIELMRGTDLINITGTKLIPVAISDTVIVTYSVLPTIKFLANYGQNTGNV